MQSTSSIADATTSDSFSVDDLESALKLCRNIALPVQESKPRSKDELLAQYEEMKVLAQFLEGFDLSVFEKL